MIWDDHQSRCIGELSFRNEVKAVKLRRDRVVVILEHKIYVYDFSHLKLLDHIETISNPKGLCALCADPQNIVLVCPGLQKGHLRVELYEIKKMNLIQGHDSSLGCIALSSDGKLLATASEKGTLIRVWDTTTGEKLQELRRGADQAEIQSLCFSPTSKWLAVSSDKGTIHIFKVRKPNIKDDKEKFVENQQVDDSKENTNDTDNTKSSLGIFKNVLPKYFTSERSFAQFRVSDSKTIVAFGGDENTILVVSADGVFYKATFDPNNGGDCSKQKEERLTFETNS